MQPTIAGTGQMEMRLNSGHAIVFVLLLLAQSRVANAELLEDLTIEHDGVTRSYDLRVPETPGDQPLALILDLHGRYMNKTSQRGFSGFDILAEQKGFIVAFPNGVNGAWNVTIGSAGVDDVGFLRALVAHLGGQYNIDPSRIYATGHSMGGGMVFRLACEAGDLFAAYSTIAIALVPNDLTACSPSRPVPILTVHGLTDMLVPYDGNALFTSASDTQAFWREKNGCQGPLEREDFGSEAWCDTDRNCLDDVSTVTCTVTGSENSQPYNHYIYQNTAGLNLAERSWDFFQPGTMTGNFRINAGLNDAWFERSTAGQGFVIVVFPEVTMMFLAWYTFDTERPPQDVTAILGDPGHRWLTAIGPYADNQAVLNVEMTGQGTFDTPLPDGAQTPGYGTLTVEFEDCHAGTVTYDIPSLGLQGAIPIERVANDLVPLCEALNSP